MTEHYVSNIVKIKSNKTVKLRSATEGDAENFIEYTKQIFAEKKYMITLPEEMNRTLEQQKTMFKQMEESENELAMIAEYDDEIVGTLFLSAQKRKRLMHVGTFGMSIHKDFRGLGLGRQMILSMLEHAKKTSLEKISLGVFATNEIAIRLYKDIGFQEEGRKIKEIKIAENDYVDDILMYLMIK